MTQREDLVSLGDMLDAAREARQIADYRNINLDRLWQAVTESIPPLIEALEKVVPREPPDSPAKPTAGLC